MLSRAGRLFWHARQLEGGRALGRGSRRSPDLTGGRQRRSPGAAGEADVVAGQAVPCELDRTLRGRSGVARVARGQQGFGLETPGVAQQLPGVQEAVEGLGRGEVREGLAVQAMELQQPVVEINNAYALFQANLETLAPGASPEDMRGVRQVGPKLWAAPDARIENVEVDPEGGPVLVGSYAVVVEGSVLRGPTIIGDSVTIERGSFVHRGLLLPRTELSPMSFVARSVVGPLYSQRIAC